MTTVRNLPTNSILIGNIADPQKQQIARGYDNGNKGYLTAEEAQSLYARFNQDKMADSMATISAFLGGARYKVQNDNLDFWQAVNVTQIAHSWKGDFHVPGFGAGNAQVGRKVGPEYVGGNEMVDVDQTVFVFNCDLVDRGLLENKVIGGAIILAPVGFPIDPGSDLAAAAEIPLTIATQDGFTNYGRGGGSSWVPDRKLLAASVETKDLKGIAGDAGLAYFARLSLDDGRTLYINRDGVPGRNFEMSREEVA